MCSTPPPNRPPHWSGRCGWFQIKSVGPKLVPFFKTAAVYFVLFIPEDRPSWLALVIKCLPILSLLVFVLLHGMSLGNE